MPAGGRKRTHVGSQELEGGDSMPSSSEATSESNEISRSGSSSGSSSSGAEIVLDESGRIPCGGKMRFEFTAFPGEIDV